MKDDIIIATALDAIKLPLLSADFDVVPASDSLADEFASTFLWENLHNMQRQTWRSHVSDALEAIDFGFAVSEITLEKRHDGRLWLKNLDPRGQETLQRWEFDDNDVVTAFEQRAQNYGERFSIPIEKCVHVTFRGRKGNPQGKALLRDLYRTWRFLKELENYEGIGVERNVGGMPVASLPEEPITEADISAIKESLRNLRMDEEMYLLVPHGVEVNPYGGGAPTGQFGPIIERKQKEILIRVFAQFLKLGMDNVGTQALVQGATDFFSLGLQGIQQELLETWNQQLVPFLFRFNRFPGMSGLPEITWNNPGKVDLDSFVNAYSTAVSAKLLTPIREDEEHYRSVADLPDLPEGEGEDPRNVEQPGGPQFFAMPSWDFHPGHPDQSVHDPRGGRGTSQSPLGGRIGSKKVDFFDSDRETLLDTPYISGTFESSDEQDMARESLRFSVTQQPDFDEPLYVQTSVAVDDYASGVPDGQGVIERLLQAEQSGDISPEQSGMLDMMRSNSQSLFGDEPRVLYRGFATIDNDALGGALNVGETVDLPADATSSWTTDINVARDFAQDGVIFSRRTNPEDVVIAPILFRGDSINDFGYQKEFVLQNSIGAFSDVRVDEIVS
jgi:hypothetical protein